MLLPPQNPNIQTRPSFVPQGPSTFRYAVNPLFASPEARRKRGTLVLLEKQMALVDCEATRSTHRCSTKPTKKDTYENKHKQERMCMVYLPDKQNPLERKKARKKTKRSREPQQTQVLDHLLARGRVPGVHKPQFCPKRASTRADFTCRGFADGKKIGKTIGLTFAGWDYEL